MEFTTVHWSALQPHNPAESATHVNAPMPFTTEISINSHQVIELHAMRTDESKPHRIEDEIFDNPDGKSASAFIIGIPWAWDTYVVFTSIDIADGLLIVLHNDPIPPQLLYSWYQAGNFANATFIKLEFAHS